MSRRKPLVFQLLRSLRSSLPLLMLVILPFVSFAQQYVGTEVPLISGNLPLSVAVDNSGNIYAIDGILEGRSFTYAVEKSTLQSNGTYVTKTLATGGGNDPLGFIAVDANQNIYYTDTGRDAIRKLTYSSGSYTASTLAITVSQPYGIALDAAGDIYVGSTAAGAVYEETLSGGTWTATTIVSGLTATAGIAVDSNLKVYVAQPEAQVVLIEIPQGSGYTQSSINFAGLTPGGVKVDASLNVYVSETSGSGKVFKAIPNGGSYSMVTLSSSFNDPADLAIDGSGNLYVADTNNALVTEIELAGAAFGKQSVQSTGTSTNNETLNFFVPAGTTVGSVRILTLGAPNLDFNDAGSSTCVAQTYVSDTFCQVNVNFTPLYPGLRRGAVVFAEVSGHELVTAPVYGTGTGPQLAFPLVTTASFNSELVNSDAIGVDGLGNLYNAHHGQVAKIAADGTVTNLTNVNMSTAHGIAIDGAGNVFACTGGGGIFEWQPDGTSTRLVNSADTSCNDVTIDGAGNLFVPKQGGDGALFKVTPSGFISQIPGTTNLFQSPNGIAIDSEGNLYVTDRNDLYKITQSGTVTTLSTTLPGTRQLAIDAADDLYIANFDAESIEEYTNTGKLMTLVTGVPNGWGVAVDLAGNVYYSGQASGTLYKMERPVPSLTFNTTTEGQVSSTGTVSVDLQNIGNQRLQFSEVHFPSGFPEVSADTNCRLNWLVHPGDDCTLDIEFNPRKQYAGSPSFNWSGSLVVSSNTLNVPSTTALISTSGTMTYPTAVNPVISPGGGTFNGPQSVTITCSTPQSTVFYTTDGTYPVGNSPQSSSGAVGFVVSSTETITALCAETGFVPSGVVKASFAISATP